jgi:3-isopropylmalate dehydrogenase
MAMLLDQGGHTESATRITDAIKTVTGTKMESQAAGRMGYSTSEVGDLVCENI